MTVPVTSRRAGPYTGTGTISAFGFSFSLVDPNHLKVVKADATGEETELTPASDYVVTLNDDQTVTPGGTVTLVVETVPTPLPLNHKLTILSAVPYAQTTDLPPGGPFSAVVVENGLDNLAIQVQQVAEEVARAVRVSATSGEDPAQFVADFLAFEGTAARIAATATVFDEYLGTIATANMTFPLDLGQITDPVLYNRFDLGVL